MYYVDPNAQIRILKSTQTFLMNVSGVVDKLRVSLNRPLIRCLGLVILLTGSARIIPLHYSVLDPDLWWHLRDGDWILANHAVPHQGLFSQYGQRPWIAYSWGFEVILSRFFHWFGFMGFVVLRAGLEAIITSALFLILWRATQGFWKTWALTALGIWAIHHSMAMRPMLFSILMFTIELGLIWEARRKKDIRPLFLLPVMFVVWANLHIQFVYGLFVLLLLTAVCIVRWVFPKKWVLAFEPEQDLPLPGLLVVSGLSLLATLVGPYSWRLYAEIVGLMRSSAPYGLILDLQAPSFRVTSHYVMVLIVAGAFFTLGWRHSHDVFKLALLSICTLVAFRTRRDAWFVCLPALAIVAEGQARSAGEEIRSRVQRFALPAATAVLAALVFMMIAWDSKVNNVSLAQAISKRYPAGACNFIRARSLPGPIYNNFDWGGFLVWCLPDYPVAIDGRTDLYGDEIVYRSFQEQSAPPDWIDDPALSAANLMLLSSGSQLAMQMERDQHFRLVYDDDLAAVFIRNKLPVSPAGPQAHR